MIDLSGQHIFVAGGSRGIGRATALMAAQAGADVTICYRRDAQSAEDVAHQVRAMGRRAFVVGADLSEDGEANRAVEAASQNLGDVSSLVVSAGIFEGANIEEMSAEFWDKTMSVNLRATFLTVRAVVSQLRQRKSGSIVIYTSTAGQRGSSFFSAYATSKGAQIMFMRSMAKELAPNRIRVNCVAPGWTETDMSTAEIDKAGRENVLAEMPLGRIGQPDDPAGAACFLLSDLASYITGSTITVDGGADMRG